MSAFAIPASWSLRTLPTVRRRLLDWFDTHRRALPWRQSRDPYRVWVSEVMLQQTTVAAVVPYFERFLTAFPTVHALAAAEEQEVLRLWAGLGYYRRARHLHQAAKHLAREYAGVLPGDPKVWSALPGVGRYILGAVLSQAFDLQFPIVEANSLRVLARLYGYRGDPRGGVGQKWVWQAAEATVPAERPGDFNQALMELGALVCTPTQPKCKQCPVAKWCEANRQNLQADIPPPKVLKDVTAVREVAVVIRDGERVLLCRRPSNAKRWADMWEVPHAEMLPDETEEEAAARVAEELTGFRVKVGEELAVIRHSVTRWSITMACREATVTGGGFQPGSYAAVEWVEPTAAGELPVSSPQRKLIASLAKTSRQRRLF